VLFRSDARRVRPRAASAEGPSGVRGRQRHQHRAPDRLLPHHRRRRGLHLAGRPSGGRDPRGRRARRPHPSGAGTPDRRLVHPGIRRGGVVSGVAQGLAPLRQRLDNGAIVIARQTPTHPAVTVYGSVPAGSGFDPEPLLGLASLTARTLDRGTATRSSEALAEAFDGFGVSLSLGTTRHHLTFGFTCLSEDLAAVLALVADVLREPVF